MENKVTLMINGREASVDVGTTVAAAVLNAGISHFRQSVNGTPRGPVCGMGICFECRVTINGKAHQRSCLILCENQMVVETDV